MKLSFFLFLLYISLCCEVNAKDQKSFNNLENVFRGTKYNKPKLKIAGDLCWAYGSTNFDKEILYREAESKDF